MAGQTALLCPLALCKLPPHPWAHHMVISHCNVVIILRSLRALSRCQQSAGAPRLFADSMNNSQGPALFLEMKGLYWLIPAELRQTFPRGVWADCTGTLEKAQGAVSRNKLPASDMRLPAQLVSGTIFNC